MILAKSTDENAETYAGQKDCSIQNRNRELA